MSIQMCKMCKNIFPPAMQGGNMKLDMIVILAMIIKLAFHFMRVGIATDLSGRPMPSEAALSSFPDYSAGQFREKTTSHCLLRQYVRNLLLSAFALLVSCKTEKLKPRAIHILLPIEY